MDGASMITRKVKSAGWISDGTPCMGTLVDEGILCKVYELNPFKEIDIVWHNISKDVIVENDYEVIYPGESVTWSK